MPKFKWSFIYIPVALAPIIVVSALMYRTFSNKDFDSPVEFSDISQTVEQILTTGPNDYIKESSPSGKIVKVGSTDDNKGLGYTGQDKVAINSNGEIFTAYRAKTKEDFEIYISKSKNGKLISNKVVTDSDGATQRVPSIAVDQNDTIHVVWYGLTEGSNNGRQVKYIRSIDNGKSWSKPTIPSLVEGYTDDEDYWQEHPQILTEGDNLYIVWEGKDSENRNQQAKFIKSNDGGKTWSQWKNINTSPNNTQSRPYLLLDSNNNLNLFFYSSRESNDQQIWHAISYDKGETWSDWKNISNGFDDSRHVSAVKYNDKIIATWRSDVDDKAELYFSILENRNWTKPQTVLESDAYQFFPVLGTNKNDEVGIVWLENQNKSEFPREDPIDSKGYFSKFDSLENKFTYKILLGENIYYPHLAAKNNYDNNFYIVYEQPTEGTSTTNKKFDIKLLTEK